MRIPGAPRLRVLDTRRRTRLAAALVLALVAVALVVEIGGDASGAEGERCASFAAASQARRAAPVAKTGQDLVVIGDSWAAGLGLDDPGRSWTSRLDGRVHVDAFSGSGFSRHASPCSGAWFAARAPRAVAAGADLVLVEGGLNDVDQSDAALRAGFARVMRAVQGPPVVVVGPAAAPAREAGARRVDAVLATLASEAGAAYVSTVGLDLDYLEDGLHLTLDGHRELGDFVARSLAELAG
ncbi:GDSL-type esterase/lipase family protein [Mumia sp. DW29H23]|uniref:GDSL-type esterase/lipase family protein n=1 Tax=Mumia sp. DW29H23 TaxID=3421241 RepID=UPI003D688051